MKIANKKSVFFDLDHTLWDFEKNSALAFEAILTNHDVSVDYVKFNEIYSIINAQFWNSSVCCPAPHGSR